MKKIAVLIVTLAFVLTSACAQSSGSFSATGVGASCQLSGQDGTFSGGNSVSSFTVNMQTSSGNGVALLIRPSLVTGLYTDTNVSTTNKNSSGISSATADVGIQVCVTVDGKATNIGPTGDTANNPGGDGCVIYDQRFQQLSTTLFNTITSCGLTSTGAAVPCYIDLIESTLAAHSFDFVAYNLSQGSHPVNVSWSVFGTNNNTAGGSTLACVGPGLLTVTQVKNFSQNSIISF